MNALLRILFTPVVFLAATGAVPPKLPPLKTADDLVRLCSSTETSDRQVCFSYILGVADTFEWLRRSNHRPSCFPEGINLPELADFVQLRTKSQKGPGDTDLDANEVVGLVISGYCDRLDDGDLDK